MALKNGNPDKKRSFLCTTGRRAHFLDRDRTSYKSRNSLFKSPFGKIPKATFKFTFRENPESHFFKFLPSGKSRSPFF